ncbi:MAG: hypothetical protein JNM55_01980 [Anaerolineales bacterium]|nr:hypothetical protein [Anaerolineales bacterium]
MPEQQYPPEFETQVRKAMDVPEPAAEKMDALRLKFIAEGKTLKTDLHPDSASKPFRPEKETNMKREPFFSSPRLVLGIILLILAALMGFALSSPDVVNALQRLFGYIPGLGVVDANTQFFMLEEPVSQTREGVTVTVEKALMNAGNISLTYKVEGLTPDKFSFLEPLNTCMMQEELHLPNGESIKPSEGISSNPLDNGFESANKYSSIPLGTINATLFIPCINGSLSPGILPENWELLLHFVPVSPDAALTMMPVIEEASPTATATPANTSTPLPDIQTVAPLKVTMYIDAGDNSLQFGDAYRQSYILFGELTPPPPSEHGDWRIDWVSLDLVDNNGQTVYWQIPNDIDLPISDSPHKLVWAIIIPEFAPPLHITQTARYAISANSQETYAFEFNAGANPQPLQEWNLNTEIQFAGRAIRLTRIFADPVRTGYIFSFESDDSTISGLSARIEGYPSTDHLLFPILLPGKSGSTWDFYEYYSESLPSGKLNVILSDLYLIDETKDWAIDWQP